MHPKKITAGGVVLDNHKFDGTTPRAAQQYLGKTWARFRAAAARRGLSFYGFRITEPHHDGCPHWHLLLFMPQEVSTGRSMVARLRALFRRYFLREDAQERGAKKNRCEFVAIDWKRGSAAGYIAKYVSKNIDGYGVQGDLEGENLSAVTGSQRVEAWASTWGIRQFQQVGGPPVGPWRELRRMQANEENTDAIEEARSAADVGNFARYVELQGGPVVPRKFLSFRVAMTREGERYNAQQKISEPASLNRYGEIAAAAVFGVLDCKKGRAFCSRFYRWIIQKAKAAARVLGAALSRPWSPVNNCTRGGNDFIGTGFKNAIGGGKGDDYGGGANVAGVGRADHYGFA